jgi:ABC-type branched-subunit amino acid transport system substrate-binding protein
MVTQAMGILTQDLVKLAGKKASEEVYSADSWLRSLENPENKYFIDAYEREFKGMPANKEGAIAFECMTFLAQAMDKAKSATDSKKIAHIYRSITFHGPRGKITFDKIGQALSTDYPIVVKNGEIGLAK